MKTLSTENSQIRLLGAIFFSAFLAACGDSAKDATAKSAATASKPALTVATIQPQQQDWPKTLRSSGNIAAWQEAVISPEISNYRITEVNANVGDQVKKGQVLARIAGDTVDSEFAEIRATVAEAEATLAEARANHERAKQLRDKGFYSAQQNTQTQTAADTALARLNAAKARLQTAELKRSKATVLAPDDGIISARTATVGTLTQPGQELFRLIRGARLEWRAEVSSADMAILKSGQMAYVDTPNGTAIEGTVRAVAPTVDTQTRNALVYVDLPGSARQMLSAGMFARGEFRLGSHPATTLPQSAILQRDGFSYVFRVDSAPQGAAGADKVTQVKVVTGRRNGERIEVSGLDQDARVVVSGAGFLADGDTVRVVSGDKQP